MRRAAALLLLAAALPSSGLLRGALPSSGLRSSTSHRAAPPLLVRAWPHAARARHPLCSSTAEEPPPAAELDAADAQAAALALKKAEDREIISIAGPALLNTLMDPFLGVVDTLFVARTCAPVALGAVAASSEIFTLCIAASLALRESASSTLVRLFAQGAVAPLPRRPTAPSPRRPSPRHPGPRCGPLSALTHAPRADRRAEAQSYAARTLQLALVVGLVLAVLIGGPCAPWCVGLMGCPVGSPLHPDALAYARTRAFALPAALALSASEGIFRGMVRPPPRAAAPAA